jgi:hypothetical protein
MSEAERVAWALGRHPRWEWRPGMMATVVAGESILTQLSDPWPVLHDACTVGHLLDMVCDVSRSNKPMHIHQEQHTDGWRGWMVEVNGADYYGESIGVALARALLGQWGDDEL